jgi:hypothetical protein
MQLFQELHDLHESWLMTSVSGDLPAPVLVIDANEDMTDVPDLFSRKETIAQLTKLILHYDDDSTFNISSSNGLFFYRIMRSCQLNEL